MPLIVGLYPNTQPVCIAKSFPIYHGKIGHDNQLQFGLQLATHNHIDAYLIVPSAS